MRVEAEAILEVVQAPVDLPRDGLGVSVVCECVQAPPGRIPGVPVPDPRQPLPGIGVDRVRVLLEVRCVRINPLSAPVAESAVVVAPCELDSGAARRCHGAERPARDALTFLKTAQGKSRYTAAAGAQAPPTLAGL